MKKFFTSVAAACLAVAGVNAQSWQATGDVVAENSVLVDNEYAKVATANQDGTVYTLLDSESQPTTITLGDYSFTKAVNIRVTDAPSKDNPTGTAHSADDGTQNIALVVDAKQNADVTLYYRIGKTKASTARKNFHNIKATCTRLMRNTAKGRLQRRHNKRKY